MGARPSSYKKSGGGGYLAQGDVTLVGYEFLLGDEVTIGKGANKGEKMRFLNLNLTFQEDGASEAKSRRLTVGNAAQYGDISDDGLTLEDPKERGLGNDEAGKFLTSLCESPNFPEDRFEEDATSINLTPMLKTRMRLHWVDNPEKTASQGPQVDDKGNKWPRRDLIVKEVYSVAPLKAGTKKAAKTEEVDLRAAADEVIAAIVEKAGGTLNRKQLGLKLQVSKSKYADRFNGQWKEISEMVMGTDYAEDASERDIVNYNPKTQVFTSAS